MGRRFESCRAHQIFSSLDLQGTIDSGFLDKIPHECPGMVHHFVFSGCRYKNQIGIEQLNCFARDTARYVRVVLPHHPGAHLADKGLNYFNGNPDFLPISLSCLFFSPDASRVFIAKRHCSLSAPLAEAIETTATSRATIAHHWRTQPRETSTSQCKV